jgi:SAM-dependent methyltransferase
MNKIKDVLAPMLSRILSRLETNPIKKQLLHFYAQAHSITNADQIIPGTQNGIDALSYWFTFQSYIDSQINQVANAYYNKKHPKHYLWLGHNLFLYDRVLPGDVVLDVGCGNSFYTQWIAEKAASVVGVDVLPDRVRMSQLNNQKNNVQYILMDVTKELPDQKFDLVICSHVLEHLVDPVSTLKLFAKKIPRILIKVPLEDSHWMKLVKRDIGLFWMDDSDHKREYTEPMLVQQLTDSGWIIDEMIRGYDLRASAHSSLCKGDT